MFLSKQVKTIPFVFKHLQHFYLFFMPLRRAKIALKAEKLASLVREIGPAPEQVARLLQEIS